MDNPTVAFASPLQRWPFAAREKRFFMKGPEAWQVAHCANTGSLKGAIEHAAAVWVEDLGEDPSRKLRYRTHFLEQPDGTLVGINTGHANTLAGLWLTQQGLGTVKAEAKWDAATRFDFCVTKPGGARMWVEVKSVSYAADGVAMFPDAVTERGTKHLGILSEIAARGDAAWQIYVVQRSDCTAFRPAEAIDPTYAAALRGAVQAGVNVTVLACHASSEGIAIAGPLPFVL
jgi:sugar fermentation stimulation protein A